MESDSGDHSSQERLFPNAEFVLETIERIAKDRQEAGVATTPEERSTLKYLRADALHESLRVKEQEQLDEILRRKQVELEYLHQVRGIRQVMPSAIFGEGYSGYGNGWTGTKVRLLYAQDRKRANRESKEYLIIPNPSLFRTVEIGETLAPVRIEFENEKYKLNETFCWNIEDQTIPIDLFVENMLEDFGLPLNVAPQVTSLVESQINGYVAAPVPQTEEEYDKRIVIKLDLTCGQQVLRDQFEWDIANPDNDPETFAQVLTSEMSLPAEFTTAVAHAIREQSQQYLKTRNASIPVSEGLLANVLDPSYDIEVGAKTFLRPPDSLQQFTPVLEQLSAESIERLEKSRDSRRRRRRAGNRSARRTGSRQTDIAGNSSDAPELNSLYYNEILPGGVDRNLDILRAHLNQQDDLDGDRDVMYYFNRLRQAQDVPSASAYTRREAERVLAPPNSVLTTLKLPKHILAQFPRYNTGSRR